MTNENTTHIEKTNTTKTFTMLFLGTVFGAILGLALAPKSGKETREELSDWYNNTNARERLNGWWNRTKEKYYAYRNGKKVETNDIPVKDEMVDKPVKKHHRTKTEELVEA